MRYEVYFADADFAQIEAEAAASGITPRQWIQRASKAALPQKPWWIVDNLDVGEYLPWSQGETPKEQIELHMSPRGRRIWHRAMALGLECHPVSISQGYNAAGKLLLNARGLE